MKLLLIGALLAVLLIGCSGDDDDDPSVTPAAVATSTQPPSATETTATATATHSPVAETPVPAATAGPPPEPACGVPLLPEGDPRRSALSDLEGRLVFACEGQIWTSNPDGTDQAQLTQPVQIDWENVRLFRVPENDPPTAEEQAQLTAQMNYAPRWLPDGRVVFASTRDLLMRSAEATEAGERRPFTYASELYAVNDDGLGLERLTDYNLTPGAYTSPFGEFDPSQCGAPTFCFAGQLTLQPVAVTHTEQIVATQITEIRFSECCGFMGFIDLSGSEPELSTRSEFLGLENPSDLRQWSWSADDELVLATIWALAFGPPIEEQDPPEVRLYDGNDFDLLPAFVQAGAVLSPDGTMVAYCEESDTGETAVLYVAGVDDGEPREVASDRYCDPDWAPDGRYLVDTDPEGRVVVIDIEKGDVIPVALGSDPDWGP